jgi:arylsulfatase A
MNTFKKLLILLPIIAASTNADAQTKLKSRPNVILIYADDLGYGELGSYGQKKIKTPYLDTLASQGMRLTQFYTGTPVCAPSRANLMTGLHSGHAQVRGNYGLTPYQENVTEPGSFPLRAGTFTMGTLFKQAGYATAAIGKWGLGNYDNTGDPQKLGFDYFYGYYDQRHAHNYYPTHLWENGKKDVLDNKPMDVHPKKRLTEGPAAYKGSEYAVDRMSGKAASFIEENKEKPFFLYLPITLPHGVFQEPTTGIEAYVKAFGEKPSTGNEITDYPRASYAAMVSYLDKQVGIIQQQLKRLKLEENTIIIFTSDNGTAAGIDLKFFNSTAGLRGVKQDVYEGGIREPFIIKWPGVVRAGSTSAYPAVTYDLLSTFSDLLGVRPQTNDGKSLLNIFKGKAVNQAREFLYWEYPANGGQLAIRIGNLKGVKTGLKNDQQAPWQLYDIGLDPTESKNIASAHPDVLRQLDAIVKREHTQPARADWDIFSIVKSSSKD